MSHLAAQSWLKLQWRMNTPRVTSRTLEASPKILGRPARPRTATARTGQAIVAGRAVPARYLSLQPTTRHASYEAGPGRHIGPFRYCSSFKKKPNKFIRSLEQPEQLIFLLNRSIERQNYKKNHTRYKFEQKA
jgi:hypothetical protein